MGRQSRVKEVVNADNDDYDDIEDSDENEAPKSTAKPLQKSNKRAYDTYMEHFRSDFDEKRSELLTNLEKQETIMHQKEAKQRSELEKQLRNGVPALRTASTVDALTTDITKYDFAESKLGNAVNLSLEKSHGLLSKYDKLESRIKEVRPSISRLAEDTDAKNKDLKRLLDLGHRVSERKIMASIQRDKIEKENSRQGVDEEEQIAMEKLGINGTSLDELNIAKVLESWEKGHKRCMAELPDDEDEE